MRPDKASDTKLSAITCLRKPERCSIKMIKLSHYEKVYYLPAICLEFFHDRKDNASKGFIEKLNIGLIKGISFGA
jgi:hypothetical protein